MKISMIGTGYVGLTSGACFAELGNDVICIDKNESKIETLTSGNIPFFEPGLENIVKKNSSEGRLNFTTDFKKAVEKSDALFICVGTPTGDNGAANLDQVFGSAEEIGQYMNGYKVIINKSTVPVGTGSKVEEIIGSITNYEFDVVSNPEFLREGNAIRDFRVPDRVVIGTNSKKAKKIMYELYHPITREDRRPIVFTDRFSAEISKYGANTILAQRLSLMNKLSQLCEKVGGNILDVERAIGLDSRIGSRFLHAGPGYGGSCFPKDVKALAITLEEYNLESELIRQIDHVNQKHKERQIEKLYKFYDDLQNKQIALWGLAFKEKTDDIRESPAITIIEQLLDKGAMVRAYDPEAVENMRQLFPKVDYTTTNPYTCLDGADALIVCTEWDTFKSPNRKTMKELMSRPVVIDLRNIMYDKQTMLDDGFEFCGLGL